MLRNILGAAAVGAAAATPSTSQCRAQHRGPVLTTGKEKESQTNGLDTGHLPVRLVDGTRLVDKEWLVADLKDSEVVFGPEDISEVINTVMGVPDRSAHTAVSSNVAIHEVDADSHMDTSSESSGADANDAIIAAGMQIAAYNAQQDNFIAALNNTMNRPDVQRVLLTALLDDPNVRTLLQDCNQVAPEDALLPPAARAGLQAHCIVAADVQDVTAEEHALVRVVAGVADRIMSAAVNLKDTAATVLIKLGSEIRGLLGRAFKPPQAEKPSKTGDNVAAEWLPKVLMTVACAVMTILLFKRLRV